VRAGASAAGGRWRGRPSPRGSGGSRGTAGGRCGGFGRAHGFDDRAVHARELACRRWRLGILGLVGPRCGERVGWRGCRSM